MPVSRIDDVKASSTSKKVHTYCAMCTSRCGVIASVQDGILTQVNADPAHPNSCICVKGTAAPEIVYSADRLRYPVVRTTPKGESDPGWVRVSWDQALNLAALRLNDIKLNHGAEAVVFSRATTAGSAAIDFDGWLQRLANAFGSPNLLTSNHICTWNRRIGSKYTYGTGMPTPDFDHSRCILLWGINPNATSPAQAARISRARARGAKLIVIDPRRTALTEKADCWMRVKPGTDGVLAMAMIHVLLEEQLYDAGFARAWTNGPFLLRADNQRLLTANDMESSPPNGFVVWDERSNRPLVCDAQFAYDSNGALPALSGLFNIRSKDGAWIPCRPVLEALKELAARFAPEASESITTVAAAAVRRAVRMFAAEKPSCYCTWVGLEQDRQAMHTNRAICSLYSLTGQFDSRGSNVIFDTPSANPITGRELLAENQARVRLGAEKYPLGPQSDPGLVQAAEVYDSILAESPYPVKAMVLFGSDPLLGHGDPLRGKAALTALDFYVHVDMVANPSAHFADLLLPAATCWEREALMPSFDIAEETVSWVQLRPAVVAPLYESRPDMEIIFDLAGRLGLGEQFFNGDIDAAVNFQLAPSGLTVQQLREHPIGIRVPTQSHYRKYAEADPLTGRPRGFDTPTGKIELYSTIFAAAAYPSLPEFQISPEDCETTSDYPLTLTFFRVVQFCDEQHRNIPRLRRSVPEPFLEIHPDTAKAQGIADGEWVSLATASGQVRLKTKFNESLYPSVVTTVYGWWQACQQLKREGYNPFTGEGANANLLVPNSDVDPISASVAHRGQRCRVTKL